MQDLSIAPQNQRHSYDVKYERTFHRRHMRQLASLRQMYQYQVLRYHAQVWLKRWSSYVNEPLLKLIQQYLQPDRMRAWDADWMRTVSSRDISVRRLERPLMPKGVALPGPGILDAWIPTESGIAGT